MRPGRKLSLALALAGALTLIGSSGIAQSLPAPGAAPVLVPAGAAAAASVPAGAKAQDIAIGSKSAGGGETLKELEALQRQAYFAELRTKLKEAEKPAAAAAPASAPSAPSPSMQFPASVAPALVPRLPHGLQGGPGIPPSMAGPFSGGFALPSSSSNAEPSSRLVNVIISGGRARADVHTNGVVTTVREGDKLEGDWLVTKIALAGVTVEKGVVEPSFRDVGGRSNAAARAVMQAPASGERVGRKASSAPVVAARPVTAPEIVERIVSVQLKPYTAGSQQFDVSPVSSGAGTMGAAVGVPPLPSGLRPPVDSTSVPSAAPLIAQTNPPMVQPQPPIPSAIGLPMPGR